MVNSKKFRFIKGNSDGNSVRIINILTQKVSVIINLYTSNKLVKTQLYKYTDVNGDLPNEY